jgi:hypothetical protein
MCRRIGREVMLSRANIGLSVRGAARLAGVAPRTFRNVERGDPNVSATTVCRVASAMGLRVWGRTFPVAEPTLRDTGQLWIAEWLRAAAHPSWSVAIELGLGNLRSIDMAFFGPTEILATEIERLLADYQAQRRGWIEKRDALAEAHQRPVKLVVAIQDTAHNRAVVRAHADIIAASFAAGSREVLASLRSGQPLGTDGIVWVRRREHPVGPSTAGS